MRSIEWASYSMRKDVLNNSGAFYIPIHTFYEPSQLYARFSRQRSGIMDDPRRHAMQAAKERLRWTPEGFRRTLGDGPCCRAAERYASFASRLLRKAPEWLDYLGHPGIWLTPSSWLKVSGRYVGYSRKP